MGNKNPIIDLFCEIKKDLKIINCDVYNEDGLELCKKTRLFLHLSLFNRIKFLIFVKTNINDEL
jgi:hypothetical protein